MGIDVDICICIFFRICVRLFIEFWLVLKFNLFIEFSFYRFDFVV